jgi:hypothetical protein
VRGRVNASGLVAAQLRRTLMTAAVAVGLIAGVLVVVAPPAGATPGWSAVPSRNPGGYGQVYLYGVSCPSTTSCFAVGFDNPPSGPLFEAALIEHWNGHAWSIMSSPRPTRASEASLRGVACPSATSCFAVGSFATRHARQVNETLVEHWNGHTWSIMTSPNPTGSGNNFLNGVSCRSTTSCFAVGSTREPDSRTLVEHWNGHKWSIGPSPNPTGVQDDSLGGVSCPSTTSCVAVGFAQLSSGNEALLEHWNGHRWSITPGPDPDPTGIDADLAAVSCSSTTSCVAVGSSRDYPAEQSLVEQWNGHRWSISPSPNPARATSTMLGGVSCPLPTQCFAVGTFSRDVLSGPQGTSSVEQTLVEHWDGHAWSIMTSPNPSRAPGYGTLVLNGVSCHRAASCFAVGDFGGNAGDARATLIERYR